MKSLAEKTVVLGLVGNVKKVVRKFNGVSRPGGVFYAEILFM